MLLCIKQRHFLKLVLCSYASLLLQWLSNLGLVLNNNAAIIPVPGGNFTCARKPDWLRFVSKNLLRSTLAFRIQLFPAINFFISLVFSFFVLWFGNAFLELEHQLLKHNILKFDHNIIKAYKYVILKERTNDRNYTKCNYLCYCRFLPKKTWTFF